jgi:hypothetical protein
MLGGVCQLQASQLSGSAQDYRGEVEGLARNLSALAADAAGILTEAESAFGGDSGSGLFVAEIEQDIRRATELLMQPCYTMDRERLIHQAFAKDDSAAAEIQAANEAEDNLDDLFL